MEQTLGSKLLKDVNVTAGRPSLYPAASIQTPADDALLHIAPQTERSRLKGEFTYVSSSASCQRPLMDDRCLHEVTSSVLSSELIGDVKANLRKTTCSSK
jgi:hypothetical protein